MFPKRHVGPGSFDNFRTWVHGRLLEAPGACVDVPGMPLKALGKHFEAVGMDCFLFGLFTFQGTFVVPFTFEGTLK